MSKLLGPAAGALAGLLIACQSTESYYYAPRNFERDPAAVCVDGIGEVESVLEDASILVEGYYEVSDILDEMYAAVDRNRWNECVDLLLEARAFYRR